MPKNTTIPYTSIHRVEANGHRLLPARYSNATVPLLDTGHFVLETPRREIAIAMRQFQAKTVG